MANPACAARVILADGNVAGEGNGVWSWGFGAVSDTGSPGWLTGRGLSQTRTHPPQAHQAPHRHDAVHELWHPNYLQAIRTALDRLQV